MSRQYLNLEVISTKVLGSASSKAPRVSSENTTPQPKGVVGPVTLEYLDFALGMGLLHQDPEVEARGSAADANDLHLDPPGGAWYSGRSSGRKPSLSRTEKATEGDET